ncbi:hypothetical protein D9M72_632360 [compost metagenome]
MALPTGVACSENVLARFSVDLVCGYGTSRYAGNCAYQVYTLVIVERTNDVSYVLKIDSIFAPFSMASSGVSPYTTRAAW